MQIKRLESLCPNFKNTDKITQVINTACPKSHQVSERCHSTEARYAILLQWFSSVQSLSQVRLFVTPWIAAQWDFLSFISWSLPNLMSIESVMPFNHLILYLPSVFPSIRVFSNELAFHIRWPKYCRFNFSISPFSDYSWLISFRLDWLDLLAVQGTLKSLL